MWGLLILFIRYKIWSDGKVIKIRMMVGRIVYMILIFWEFRINLFVSLVDIIVMIMYRIKVLIKNIIIKVWLWKYKSFFIIGDVVFWNFSCVGCVIRI